MHRRMLENVRKKTLPKGSVFSKNLLFDYAAFEESSM